MMQEMNYIRFGDYYIPDIRLPEENRPIGRWGRMHRDYIKEHNPIRFNDLCLSGEPWTYLADLNEQAQSRLELMSIGQRYTTSKMQAEPTCCIKKWALTLPKHWLPLVMPLTLRWMIFAPR